MVCRTARGDARKCPWHSTDRRRRAAARATSSAPVRELLEWTARMRTPPPEVPAMSPDHLFGRYRELQSYVGWTEDDARRVAALAPLLAGALAPLVNDFYAEID